MTTEPVGDRGLVASRRRRRLPGRPVRRRALDRTVTCPNAAPSAPFHWRSAIGPIYRERRVVARPAKRPSQSPVASFPSKAN